MEYDDMIAEQKAMDIYFNQHSSEKPKYQKVFPHQCWETRTMLMKEINPFSKIP